MNRHLARTLAMQTLYEWDFQKHREVNDLLKDNVASAVASLPDEFTTKLVEGTVEHKDEIDDQIAKAAPEWPLEQISIVDKSILRVAVYELLHENDVPAKVVINEAVELAKTFGGDNTSKFVNGVLGTIYRKSPRYIQDTQNDSA